MLPHGVMPLPTRRIVLLTTVAAMIGLIGVSTMVVSAQPSAQTGPKPTIVLVHGAFADASGWNDVASNLQREGYVVVAPANPLRGIAADSAYIATLVGQIDGPVLLVGHSYGGAVVSNAAASIPNAIGLVIVAGFVPEVGERLLDVTAGSKDSILGSALVQLQYPTGQDSETAIEFAINPALFRESFAADLPPEQTAVMAATQRPVAELAFSEPSKAAAWKTLPTWSVVATGDKAAGADITRSMAQRAKATIVEVKGSHVIMISQPSAVTDVILQAARVPR